MTKNLHVILRDPPMPHKSALLSPIEFPHNFLLSLRIFAQHPHMKMNKGTSIFFKLYLKWTMVVMQIHGLCHFFELLCQPCIIYASIVMILT